MSYCVRQKNITLDLLGSKEILQAKNGGWRMRLICIGCNANKSRFISKKEGKGLEEVLFKASAKGSYNLGKKGVSKALKSNFARNKLKSVANNYLNKAIDSATSDLADKINPLKGKGMHPVV